MDLEGQWNPPEVWPEATPPLPGWKRDDDGLWTEPAVVESHEDSSDAPPSEPVAQSSTARPVLDIGVSSIPSLESLQDDAVVQVVPERRVADDRRTSPTKSESILTFAEATANLTIAEDIVRERQQAIMAASLAAVTASMLAAGLVLLLLLL